MAKELMQDMTTDQKLDALIEMCTTMEADIKKITQAFPEGDYSGHREYHKSVIEWMRLRNHIFRECLVAGAKLGSGGLILFILWACLKSAVSYLTSAPYPAGPLP